MSNVISTTGLSKSYQDADKKLTVIQNLNFQVKSGAALAIVGKSGVGKSTLLNLLAGLDQPSSGKISIVGKDISTLKDDALAEFRSKNIGFVFQFHHLLPEFSALENIAMPLIIQGESESVANQRAKEMLQLISLADRSKHRPGELSGGEQQRVSIARALITNPKIIFADEPTGNLDQKTASQVVDLLIGCAKQLKQTLIFVTHNTELASQMEQRYEMKPGGELEEIS